MENQKEYYPNLSKIAQNYLSVHTSTVSVERAFSKTADIVRVKRSKLEPELVNDLILLKKLIIVYYLVHNIFFNSQNGHFIANYLFLFTILKKFK